MLHFWIIAVCLLIILAILFSYFRVRKKIRNDGERNARIRNTIIWCITVAVCGGIAELLADLSLILLGIFVILAAGACVCIYFSESVIPVTVTPVLHQNSAEARPVTVYMKQSTDEGFQAECAAAAFFPEMADAVRLYRSETDRSGRSFRANSLRNSTVTVTFGGTVIKGPDDDLINYLRFRTAPMLLTKKTLFTLLSTVFIGIGTLFCVFFNNKYEKHMSDAERFLSENLSAASQEMLPETAAVSALQTEKTEGYFQQVPDVHILIILKEQNRYLPAEGAAQYLDPQSLNTVLMFYEDNLTGGLREAKYPLKTTSAVKNIWYYNLTELYMNIPIRTDDRQTHMLGALFDGSLPYQNQTGFAAVKAWFKEQYSVNVASFTEIPQTVFSGLFGAAHTLGISVNDVFLSFMRKNYSGEPAMQSACVQAMLHEQMPVYSDSVKQQIEALYRKLDAGSEERIKNNAVLFLNGSDLLSFANSVRLIGQPEPEQNPSADGEQNAFSAIVSTDAVMHSNWDLVIADLLESMTEMNNSTFNVFCGEQHTDALSQIRSTIPSDQLKAFLYKTVNTSLALPQSAADSTVPADQQIVFSIRNLNMKVHSQTNDTNLYLLAKPLMTRAYMNNAVRNALFFCLSEPKNG